MKMSDAFYDELAKGFARQVCDGEKTLLQIERILSKHGWNKFMLEQMMQRIRDKVSERKKGNG